MAGIDGGRRVMSAKTSKNSEPTAPRIRATKPREAGIFTTIMPIVPKIIIDIISSIYDLFFIFRGFYCSFPAFSKKYRKSLYFGEFFFNKSYFSDVSPLFKRVLSARIFVPFFGGYDAKNSLFSYVFCRFWGFRVRF